MSAEADQFYPSAFEAAVEKALTNIETKDLDHIEIDFTGVVYIDIVTVLNISSFLEVLRKTSPDLNFTFILPPNEKLLLFIKTWKVDEALAKAAGKDSFFDLLNDDSKAVYQQYCEWAESNRKPNPQTIESLGTSLRFCLRYFVK